MLITHQAGFLLSALSLGEINLFKSYFELTFASDKILHFTNHTYIFS